MDIREILDDRIIITDMIAKDKDDVLTQLSIRLKDAKYINDVDDFKADIYEREKEGITGIGNYVAIPHGKSGSVSKVGIAIAKLKEEIEWETLDGKGVKVIFLFAVSNDHEYAKNHMQLLAQIARKLGDDESIDALLKAQSINDMKAILA